MTVFRKPNGRWCAQVYDAGTGRMRQVGTYATRKEAKAAEVEANARISATGRETVGSFAARWLTDFPRPKASTNVHNAERTRRFAEQHARKRIDAITAADARAWALRRPADVPALRAMFNDARKLGLVMSTRLPLSAWSVPEAGATCRQSG